MPFLSDRYVFFETSKKAVTDKEANIAGSVCILKPVSRVVFQKTRYLYSQKHLRQVLSLKVTNTKCPKTVPVYSKWTLNTGIHKHKVTKVLNIGPGTTNQPEPRNHRNLHPGSSPLRSLNRAFRRGGKRRQ